MLNQARVENVDVMASISISSYVCVCVEAMYNPEFSAVPLILCCYYIMLSVGCGGWGPTGASTPDIVILNNSLTTDS